MKVYLLDKIKLIFKFKWKNCYSIIITQNLVKRYEQNLLTAKENKGKF